MCSPLYLTFFHNYTEIIADGSFREVKGIRNFFIADVTETLGADLQANKVNYKEEVLFQIGYGADITTANMVRYNGTLYNITRIDTFEGCEEDLTLYCSAKIIKSRNRDIILMNKPCRAILLMAVRSHAQEGYSYDLQL